MKMLTALRAAFAKLFSKTETFRACDISRADAQRVKNINAYS